MKTLLAFLALLALLPACAASRSASEMDDQAARDDGGAQLDPDAASEPSDYVPESIPDTTVPECLPTTSDSQSGDSTFGRVYGEAHGTCDRQQVGGTCGNVLVELDADGCVIGVTGGIANLNMADAERWFDCMAAQLAGACSRCEAFGDPELLRVLHDLVAPTESVDPTHRLDDIDSVQLSMSRANGRCASRG